jgi:hypothetical protein
VGADHGTGDHPLPGLQGHGDLRVVPGESDPSVYVWLRRFDSEAQREAQYKDVYESEYWKTQIAPRVPEYLDRSGMVITRLIPTAKSTVQ